MQAIENVAAKLGEVILGSKHESKDPTGQAEHKILTAFISFPSPYTETLLQLALSSNLPYLSLMPSFDAESEPTPDRLLCWADYDVLPHELIQARSHRPEPSLLASSYIYRKTLIRKHQLHTVVQEFLAKHSTRRTINPALAESPLRAAVPRGWVIDVQFADELDELWQDELYDMALDMDRAEADGSRRWFILKPGMSDKGQGIRLFSSRGELAEIFEEMEDDSGDEEDDEEDEDRDDKEDEDEASDAGVAMSQLRHFVIQEYLPSPMLLAPSPTPGGAPANHKFHLRTYVMLSGAYDVHLARTTLALFSSLPYSPPSSAEESLLPHLTNTCLQPPMSPGEVDETNVHLLWELEGRETMSGETLTRDVLEGIWADCGTVAGAAITAAVECGSVGLQLLPNCFEIFGVDFLVTVPSSGAPVARPQVHLLEFNASPDFHQSGTRLQTEIRSMFDGVVTGIVAPFFGVETVDEQDKGAGREDWSWEQGTERAGWKCFVKGEVRRGW